MTIFKLIISFERLLNFEKSSELSVVDIICQNHEVVIGLHLIAPS